MKGHPTLDSELLLPSGARLKNRIAKAPLSEGLADPDNCATHDHVRLYGQWADGGAGLIITGNVQVDRRYLERPGNIVIDMARDESRQLSMLRAYAKAGTRNGAHLWMQLNHPGRQSPRRICAQPVSPSGIPLNIPSSAYAPPRAMEAEEIEELPHRFAWTAVRAQELGFTGVQVHAAHGYLLSQFLSPLANHRQDQWGGSLANRARLLLSVVDAIRAANGPGFCVSVKLNTSDFQLGGFTDEDCAQVISWLEVAGVDLVEVSGGSYEKPAMLGVQVRASTLARESFFSEYAASIKAKTRVPIMLTGGMRTRAGMEAALDGKVCDVIGLGRPMCLSADVPAKLIAGAISEIPRLEDAIRPRKAVGPWYCMQLIQLARGVPIDTSLGGDDALLLYAEHEDRMASSVRAASERGPAAAAGANAGP